MLFETAEDKGRQRAIARRLSMAWNCRVVERGGQSRVDWEMIREQNIVAVAELKCRNCPSTRYPTVFLSKMKYDALMADHAELSVPALYIVQFLDAVCFINIATLKDTKTRKAGRPPREGSTHDIEDIIDVPIAEMRKRTWQTI